MLKSNLLHKGIKNMSIKSSNLDLNHKTFNNSTHPLVAWYDFTDVTTLDRDQSGTPVSANGHPIGRIRNKANPSNGASYKLGTHLDQTSSGSKPAWTSDNTIAGSYGQFDGADDFLLADQGTGAVSAGKLSDTILSGDAFTAFFVAAPDNAALAASEGVFGWMDQAQSYAWAQVNASDDEFRFLVNDNVSRVTATMDSGIDSNTLVQVWMVIANCGTSGSTSIMYKNGIKTGVSNQAGNDYDYDFSANDADVSFIIGGNTKSAAAVFPGSYWDGKIHEVIIFDGILPQRVYTQIANYLTIKYNITRLI
jgi:hypothetical protein